MAIIDVIKYEGGNNVLAWKHPKEDFNTSAQLIVHETQEAYIFKDGQLVGPYSAGKHTIKTENLPGVRHLIGLVTGGINPNHYEVYYINKVCSMEILWGTSTPWTIQDPSLQIPFEMQANGQFAIRVSNSKDFLLKLIGTITSFTKKNIHDYFSGIMISRIKDCITNTIKDEELSHSDISSHLVDISERVRTPLSETLGKYGLSLEEFVVENISIIKDEVYDDVRKAMGTRASNTIKGVTEQEKMGQEVAKAQAQNPGTGGQFGQVFTGIAAGAAVAPAIGGMVRNAVQPFSDGQSNVQHRDQFSMGTVRKHETTEAKAHIKCNKCGFELDEGSKFCNQCGTPVSNSEDSMLSCPVCGAKLPANSKFCNSCGTKL